MTYLLDTNVISELRKGERCDPGVRTWMAGVAADHLHISVLTIGELRRGVEVLGRRDPQAARSLNRWLCDLTESHADRLLGIGVRVADEWGRLNVPDPLTVIDGLLAATASVHQLTLVTRNTKDVERTGVACFNPFERSGERPTET